jgi:hypothetical protein
MFFFICAELEIHVRENRRGNQERTIQRKWQHLTHKKTNKTKHTTQHNTTQKAKKMNNIHPTKKPRVNIGAREG